MIKLLDETYHFSTVDYYFKTAKVFRSASTKSYQVLERKEGFRIFQMRL